MESGTKNIPNQTVTQNSFEYKICERLSKYLLDKHEQQRREFADDPDMLFKLNVHFPTVYCVAQKIAPDNETIQLAALYHDYGRVIQFKKNGNFNNHEVGSSEDHHVAGYKQFLKDIPEIFKNEDIPPFAIQKSLESGTIYKISKTILLHGLNGKAFDEEFAKLDDETNHVVEIISQIDDIANGTQCVEYLLKEAQEHAKNVSHGGFIPDENENLKIVSPRVMELFRKNIPFDRNAECKTYADYCIFGASLATRSLKNPTTYNITREMVSVPTVVRQHSIIDGEDVLVSKKFDSAMEAFEYIFSIQMEEADAKEAYSILSKCYNG